MSIKDKARATLIEFIDMKELVRKSVASQVDYKIGLLGERINTPQKECIDNKISQFMINNDTEWVRTDNSNRSVRECPLLGFTFKQNKREWLGLWDSREFSITTEVYVGDDLCEKTELENSTDFMYMLDIAVKDSKTRKVISDKKEELEELESGLANHLKTRTNISNALLMKGVVDDQ